MAYSDGINGFLKQRIGTCGAEGRSVHSSKTQVIYAFAGQIENTEAPKKVIFGNAHVTAAIGHSLGDDVKSPGLKQELLMDLFYRRI